jgi:uncharacterized protein YaiE (UPF0345 family)
MRILFLITILTMLTVTVQAQGVFVDEGQSGAFFQVGFAFGDHHSAAAGMVGYMSKGLFDIGVTAGVAEIEIRRYRRGDRAYTESNTFTTVAEFFTLYPARLTTTGGSGVILSIDQAFGIQESETFIMIGGDVSVKLQASQTMALVFTAGSEYLEPWDSQIDGVSSVGLALSLAVGSNDQIFALTSSLSRSEGLDSYGLALGVSFLPAKKDRHNTSGP